MTPPGASSNSNRRLDSPLPPFGASARSCAGNEPPSSASKAVDPSFPMETGVRDETPFTPSISSGGAPCRCKEPAHLGSYPAAEGGSPMNYLNLEVSVLHAREFVDSTPRQQSCWLRMLLWSVQQENGGRITGAASWTNRIWTQTCGVLLKDVKSTAQLWSWNGSDLLLLFYPNHQEAVVRGKRKVARTNGMLGGRPQRKKPTSVSGSVTSGKPTSKTEIEIGIGKGTVSVIPGFSARALEIYEAYPRKQAKDAALAAISAALSTVSVENLLERTKAYAEATAAWPEDDRKFIPYPAKWYSEARYDDDPAEWSRHAPKVDARHSF